MSLISLFIWQIQNANIFIKSHFFTIAIIFQKNDYINVIEMLFYYLHCILSACIDCEIINFLLWHQGALVEYKTVANILMIPV